MTTTYRIKTERQSLTDVFWFEPREQTCFISTTEVVYNIFDQFVGFNGYTFNPSITWEELELRKDELRPDLKEDMNFCVNYDLKVSPLYNPFELINIAEYNFETFENFTEAYSKKFIDGEDAIALSNLWVSLYTEANNIITEEVLVDGVKIDYATRFK